MTSPLRDCTWRALRRYYTCTQMAEPESSQSSRNSGPTSGLDLLMSGRSQENSRDEMESDSTAKTSSLLDRLKCPTRSGFSRTRKFHSNPHPTGKKGSTGQRKVNHPDVRPSKRVSEYPGKSLTVSAGQLFCKACGAVPSVKRRTTDSHVKCAKHAESKKRVQQNESRERDIP